MKRLIGTLVLIFLVFSNSASPNEKLADSLKEGGKLIFIRHAHAPGNGDPENFNLKDCSSQRNLNQQGINQSKKIGLFFTLTIGFGIFLVIVFFLRLLIIFFIGFKEKCS